MAAFDTFNCPLLSGETLSAATVDIADITNEEKGVQAITRRLGFCIVKSVLTSEECEGMERLMNEDLCEVVDEKAVDAAPAAVRSAWKKAKEQGVGHWPAASLAALGDKNRFQLRGMPHGRFAWACRLHPNVRRVYEVLHQTDRLVSSFDNSFVAPLSASLAHSNRLWPHVDQNDCDTSRDFKSWDVFQGLLYVWPSEEPRSSTTVLWPASHLPEIYDLYMNDPKIQARAQWSHFTMISSLSESPAKETLKNGWLDNAVRIPVPAGGLLVWQSRVTHQGWSGGPRLAQPVCWEPVERRDEETKKRKAILTAVGFPSTHSASLGNPHHLVKKHKPSKSEGDAGNGGESVVFPLRETVNSVGVREGVSSLELWDRLGGWKSPIAKEKAEAARQALKEEYLDVL